MRLTFLISSSIVLDIRFKKANKSSSSLGVGYPHISKTPLSSLKEIS